MANKKIIRCIIIACFALTMTGCGIDTYERYGIAEPKLDNMVEPPAYKEYSIVELIEEVEEPKELGAPEIDCVATVEYAYYKDQYLKSQEKVAAASVQTSTSKAPAYDGLSDPNWRETMTYCGKPVFRRENSYYDRYQYSFWVQLYEGDNFFLGIDYDSEKPNWRDLDEEFHNYWDPIWEHITVCG